MSEQNKSTKAKEIFAKIEEFLPEMIAIRHDLHAHPELAYEEHRTSAIIADLLKKWGYDVTTGLGKTGVVGQLKLGIGGKKIGIRADFDALPLDELTNLPYRSQNEGKMHACGHDGHTTILLTAARYLAQTRNFNGTVNLIFQPAEEGFSGAKAMIDDGLFEKFPCDIVYGMHNWPGAEIGSIASRKGSFMPASDSVSIRILGKGGHGAAPHLSVDPIVAGASFIMALQSVVSRNIDPLETAVVTVGAFNAGHATNIIPDSAEMLLTVRSFCPKIRDLLEERITKLAKDQAESFGAEAIVDYKRCYPVLVNHNEETEYALGKAAELFGSEQVNIEAERASGSEDFAFMLEECKGAYLFIGNGDSAPLHNPHYDFNDKIIPYGASYWSYLVEDYLS